jgi:S-DNA-T family DNA segregation ATPase FtsK/SpoIIIE
MYEFEPVAGLKISKIVVLADDIARSMSAMSVRIAKVPGKSFIGIEVANPSQTTVYLRDIVTTEAFQAVTLPLGLGKDIAGRPVIEDLAKMPHLLVAGATGAGKSVAMHSMLLSLLYKLTPSELRMLLIDPKMLEFSLYKDIPHLLHPVVIDPKEAVIALKWAVGEMGRRYKMMSECGVRDIVSYNSQFPPIPYIVVVVDEMADLMAVAGKEIELAVQRLAQMARAAGIHIIMATQRPSVDVITGTIKANFPSRISFRVSSQMDSRTIIGQQGAEQLLGRGDMLYMGAGGQLMRAHGPFVSEVEVQRVCDFLRALGKPNYVEDLVVDVSGEEELVGSEGGDERYAEAVELVRRTGKASTSFLVTNLGIGYNRASRIIQEMERRSVVSEARGAGHVRDVL